MSTMAEKTSSGESKPYSLPDDLIRCILLLLPAKSIIRFRSVSKSWLSITTDPSFLLSHTLRSPNSLLIHTTNNHSTESTRRTINLRLLFPSPSRFLVSRLLLPDRRRSPADVVFACCDGLICFRDRTRETLEQEDDVPCYYVINPLTGRRVDVPKPRFSLGHLMGLYLHPPTGEYRLIRRVNSSIINNKIEIITLGGRGGESWRTIQHSPPKELVCARIPIDLKGNLYWIAYNVNELNASAVLRFDVREEEFKLIPLPARERRHFTNNSLFRYGERLGLSIIDRELSSAGELGVDIWGLKDHGRVEWEKMHSVRCSGGSQVLDFRFGYSVDDIALLVKEEMYVLFVGPHSYLVRIELSSMRYCAEEVTDPENTMWHFSLLHKETLISF